MARSKATRNAGVLLPVAVLSSAWTITMAVPSSGVAPTAESPNGAAGVTIPGELPVAPASVTSPLRVTTRGQAAAVAPVVSVASTNGIPAAALAAYQRAAQVIDSADPACKVDWPFLAAVGRVESDHGRYGGSVLDNAGVARPAIYGLPLNGSKGTARIPDTDAGELDGDSRFDRAVGPLQFLPATWHAVGVDGDADGARNPQDIDDAALAAAVYLCSGGGDLSTDEGATSALLRYNHSREYAALVRSTADTYRSGAYSSVPTLTFGSVSFSAAPASASTRPARKPQTVVSAATAPQGGWVPKPSETRPEEKPAADAPARTRNVIENVAEALEATTGDTLDGTVGAILDKLGLDKLGLGGLLKQS